MSCSCCGFAIIDNTDVGILQTLGKFTKTLNPGFHLYIPCLRNVAGVVSTRNRQINFKTETKTSDNVFVKLDIAVQYKINPEYIYEAYYTLSNPTKQMEAYIENCVRSMVPKMTLDTLFESTDEISASVNESVSAIMQNYGYQIIKTLVTDIHPAGNVKDAMNEINAAKRLREAAVEKAEAEKIMKVKAAEAEKETKILQGEGVAGERNAIMEGYRKSIQNLSNELGIDNQEIMNMTLMTQYIDMLDSVGKSGPTTFIHHNPAGLSNLKEEFRAAILESKEMKK